MKKIELIINPFKLDEVKKVLAQEKVRGVIISEIKVCNQLADHVELYRGAIYGIATFLKVKIEVIVEDDKVRTITDKIVGTLQTPPLCEGELAILPMNTTVRTRTGLR